MALMGVMIRNLIMSEPTSFLKGDEIFDFMTTKNEVPLLLNLAPGIFIF